MAVERVYPNYRPDEWQEPQLEPQKKKVKKTKVVGISRIKSRIHIINNYDCVDKYLYAIFKNGCV